MLFQSRVARTTFLIVIAIVFVKVVLEHFGLEPFSLGPLLTSFFAGGIFLVSFILAGILADYKESEKLPAEVATSLQNIYEEGALLKRREPKFNLTKLAERLGNVVTALETDLKDTSAKSRVALAAVSELTASFQEMEDLGVLPNFMVRLRTEQGIILKGLLRTYQIQKTNFLPSAYFLVKSVVVLIIGLLLLTNIEPRFDSFVIVGFASYLFTYVLQLIGELDTPFRIGEKTTDDVSLFLLREFRSRVAAEKEG